PRADARAGARRRARGAGRAPRARRRHRRARVPRRRARRACDRPRGGQAGDARARGGGGGAAAPPPPPPPAGGLGPPPPAARREVSFLAPAVPGYGWRSFRWEAGDGPGTAVAAERTTVVNEHLRVEVDPFTGTFTLEGAGVRVTGANRYADGGDGGDTYNYSPP